MNLKMLPSSLRQACFMFLLCLLIIPVAKAEDGADSDGDGIVDDEDFCDGEEASANLGSAGEASVVHYYFGDGKLESLAQDIGLNLKYSVEGYDYSIALSENDDAGDLDDANEINTPTKEHFFEAIRDVVRRGYLVDIYIFAHGHTGEFSVRDYSDTEDDENDGTAWLSTGDIKSKLSPNSIGCNGRHVPVRIVYSVSCVHSTLNETWTETVGARASLGARDVNFYPNQFDEFGKSWQDGSSFRDAETASNTSLSRTASQIYITADALVSHPWYCTTQTPLGNNTCADVYFPEAWLGDDYDDSQSGQWNMNHTSDKLFSGDENVTRNDVDFDWRASSDVQITEVEMTDDWTETRKISIPTFGSSRGKTVQTDLKGTFQVTVRNGGDYDVGSFYVTGPSGSTVSRIEVPSLKNHTITTVSFTVRVAKKSDGTPDADSLTFTADEEGALNDADTSNNAMTVSLKPNYEVLVNQFTTTADEGGETYTTEIQCYARNIGYLAATETSTMKIYFNQSGSATSDTTSGASRFSVSPMTNGNGMELVGTFTTPALSPGQGGSGNTPVSYQHTIITSHFLPVENSFVCEVDTDDVIDETDETDNTAEECVYCASGADEPEMADFTLDASKIMTVFTDAYLEIQPVHVIDETDMIIIVVEFMQSTEFLELRTEFLDAGWSRTRYQTELSTRINRYVSTRAVWN